MQEEIHSSGAIGSAIEWPTGGLPWTDDLRYQLPVVRGVRTQPLPHLEALFDIEFRQSHGFSHAAVTAAAARHGWPWQPWTNDQAAQAVDSNPFKSADPERWTELIVQFSLLNWHAHFNASPKGLAGAGGGWVTSVGILMHGLPFMLERVDDLFRQFPTAHSYCQRDGVDRALQNRIVAASDDEHAQAMAWLEAHPPATPEGRLRRALMCPHRADWAEACCAESPKAAGQLLQCVLSPEVALACQQQVDADGTYGRVPTHLLLQLHLHGTRAFPLVADLARRATRQVDRKVYIDFALQIQDPQMVRLLAEMEHAPEARKALDGLAARHPLAVMAARFEHARTARGWVGRYRFLRHAFTDRPLLERLRPALAEADQKLLDGWLAALQVPEAEPQQVPVELVQPPWLNRPKPAELPRLEANAPHTPWRLNFDDDERTRLLRPVDFGNHFSRQPMPDQALYELGIEWGHIQRMTAGEPFDPRHVGRSGTADYQHPTILLALPEAMALEIWNQFPARYWKLPEGSTWAVRRLLLRHGEAAAAGLVNLVRARPEAGFECARGIDLAELVPLALSAAHRLGRAGQPAWAWIVEHVPSALAQALPLAFGGPGALRDAARHALRQLLPLHGAQVLDAAATMFGPDMVAAVQASQGQDDTDTAPAAPPRRPAFFVPELLPRPVLRDNGMALPLPAMEHLCSLLMLGTLARPHPALAAVLQACTPASLVEFSLGLFDAWLMEGAPVASSWALHALAWLGGDAAASRLAPLVRAWPTESANQRALQGVEVLAAIGSDVALLHLHGLAGQQRFKPLQTRARQCIAEIAAQRGLSDEQLADRLVPDLGLDARGTLELDYGARRFSVGFDAHLAPWVRGADGRRLASLPRRQAGDDAALVKSAGARLRQLKQDARTAAGTLVPRLQAAMLARRRWSAAEFRLLFVEHPFSRHVAARLVWGTYGADGRLQSACRIAEDGTLADADDRGWTANDAMRFGIVHPLELDEATRTAFGRVLAEYELMQPFPQLQRETFLLADDERAAARLQRFAGAVVTEGTLKSLLNRGWQGGEARYAKQVTPGLRAELALRPGPGWANLGPAKEYLLDGIVLQGGEDGAPPPAFGQLDPIDASELLRDVWRLTGSGR